MPTMCIQYRLDNIAQYKIVDRFLRNAMYLDMGLKNIETPTRLPYG